MDSVSIPNYRNVTRLLPKITMIRGSLDISGCTSLNSLPDELRVEGSLNISNCASITTIPDSLLMSCTSINIGNSGVTDAEVANIEDRLKHSSYCKLAVIVLNGGETRSLSTTCGSDYYPTSSKWENLYIGLQMKKKGNVAYKQKDYTKAIYWFSKAINADPTNFVFYSNRAASLLLIHDYQQAALDCLSCIKLNGNYYKAYFRGARSFQYMGHFEECMEMVDAYLKRPYDKWTSLFEGLKKEISMTRYSWRLCIRDNHATWEQLKASGRGYFICKSTRGGTLELHNASTFRLQLDNDWVCIQDVLMYTFTEKERWFRKQMEDLHLSHERGYSQKTFRISRSNILEDSSRRFQELKAEDMRRTFRFQFEGEEGIDAGGVSREWFDCALTQCLNLEFGLFEYIGHNGDNDFCYHMCPNSEAANEHHLDYYWFLGRLLGKALFDGIVLPASFSVVFYKLLLGCPMGLEDVKCLDSQMFSSFKMVEECPDISSLYLTFSVTKSAFGGVEIVDLKPGGRGVDVVENTVDEYLELLLKDILLGRIKKQMEALHRGFYEIIPANSIMIFTPNELENLLCGNPTIDVMDWRKHTLYRGYSNSDKLIQWFWKTVEGFSQDQRALLLQFSTGSRRCPVDGFKALPSSDGRRQLFTIQALAVTDGMPLAHTCFNRIDLPRYKTKAVLESRLKQVLKYATGFGME